MAKSGISKDLRNKNKLNRQFFLAVLQKDMDSAESARQAGADVNAVDPISDLSPIHAAIVVDDLPMAKYLLEDCNAKLQPDANGRWPTILCCYGVSRKLNDYILDAEAKHVALQGPE